MHALVLLVAIVAEDPAVLRNAPRDDAPAQAALWRGDWLEVRGETAGFLKVYDHRHERPGYIRPQVVRLHRLDEASAPDLAAVVRFLRDAGGSESLGIGYAALFLRAAPAGADASEVFAAIGTMADRLARRASGRKTTLRDAALAGHLEVAQSYGVRFESQDEDANEVGEGHARLCYDGEAWARVLATPGAPPVEKARAALFLAGTRCQPALLPPAQQRAFNDRRLQVLGEVDPTALAAWLGGRVRLARAEALAWRAFDEARRADDAEAATKDEAAAIKELALTDRGVLAPEDLARYDETAMRVAAGRWATEPASRDGRKRIVAIATAPRARRDLRPRGRLRRARERQRQASRRALHLRRRVVERPPLGTLRNDRDARRPAAPRLDRALGRPQVRRHLDDRYARARDDRARPRLRRERRLLPRRRPSPRRPRGPRRWPPHPQVPGPRRRHPGRPDPGERRHPPLRVQALAGRVVEGRHARAPVTAKLNGTFTART